MELLWVDFEFLATLPGLLCNTGFGTVLRVKVFSRIVT